MRERRQPLSEDAALPAHLDPRGRGRRRDRGSPPARDAAVVRPPSRRRRRLRRVALGTIAVLLLATLSGLATLAYFDRQIDRIAVPTLGEGPDVDGGDVNYLLVGSDSRSGLTAEELAEARTEANNADGTLTDTILLLHLPGGGGAPTLVSFPRDSFVDIPGGGTGRINSAFSVGEAQEEGSGPATLVATVSQLSGLQIDHYVEVGFVAFLRITEAIGGVEVDLCAPVQDSDSGIDLPAGEQRLDGGDALAFVRQRQGLPRGDLDRVARQQYFLGSIARQTLTPALLLRPDRAVRLLDAVTSSIRADEGLSAFDLARLAFRLRGAAANGLASMTVPVADPDARRGGASVVLLDEAALPGFFAGLSPQTESAAPSDLTVPPSAIRLEVRNGTDRGGLAGQAADDLRAQGFTVSGVGNADQGGQSTSLVLHGTGRADSARTVAAAVPGAQVQADDSLGENGLVLVVGEDYAGARGVTVAPPAAEAPPEAPAPGPAPEGPAEPQPEPEPEERPCIT